MYMVWRIKRAHKTRRRYSDKFQGHKDSITEYSRRTLFTVSWRNPKSFIKMKTVHCAIIYLVMMAGVTPCHGWCWTDALLAAGGVAVGVVAAPAVVTAGLGAVGFSAAGTAAGSAGAALMSTYGGSIAAGSAVSLMQSAGAAGIGVAGQALGGAVGGAVAYAAAGGNCDPEDIKCKK